MSTHAPRITSLSPLSPSSSTPSVRKRKPRWVKALIAILILIVFAIAAAPTIIAKTALRNRIARMAAADLNGSIVIGGASLGWFSRIELRDVVVTDSRGRTLAKIPKAASSRTLVGLIRNRGALGEFVLDQPVVEVVCESGTSNLEEVICKYLKEDGGPRGSTRPELTIRIQGGTLVLRAGEKADSRGFRDVDGSITIPGSRSEPITAQLTANAPGPINAELSIGESGRAKLKADGFALETVAPLLRRFSFDLAMTGSLSADVSAMWGKDTLEIDGKVGARSLAVSGEWSKGDTLRMDFLELPIRGAVIGDSVRIDRANLTSDFGSISVTGAFDTQGPIEKLLDRPSTKLDASIDLAKFARTLPRLLRIRDRTEIREGKLIIGLESRAAPDGTDWIGKVDTSALRALQDGREVRWDSPLAIEFAGRYRPGRIPMVERLTCRSDFIALHAEVKPDSVRAAANIHLDKLAERLAEFVDLGGASFDGRGGAAIVYQRDPDGSFKAEGSLDLKPFAFTDRSGKGLREGHIALRFSGAGRAPDAGPVAISTARATLTAGADELDLTLTEPIADAKLLASGTIDARLSGDLGRWWKRAGVFVRLPKSYVLAGATTARGRVRFARDSINVHQLTMKLANARFLGAGLDFDEPQMDAVADLAIDTQAMTAVFENFTMNSAPLSVASGRLLIQVPDTGPVVVEGTGPVAVGLGRLGKTLKLFTDPRGPNSIHGRGTGLIKFRNSGDVTTFDSTLDIEKFSIGLPTAPDWTEPSLKIVAEGSYTESTSAVSFAVARVERPGFAFTSTVKLEKLDTTADLNLNGMLNYDLAKLAPKLREQLGGNLAAQGRGVTPVTLSGSLFPQIKKGKKPKPGILEAMNGEIRLGWDSLRAYGFDMGRSELHGTLNNGVGRISPIAATFGGGRVNLQPTVHLDVEPGFFTLAKGRIVERAKLSPAACAEALGYALPAIARSGKAEGELSVTIGENRIPFSDSSLASVKGQITIHRATVAPGPVAGEIAKLLGAGNLAMTVPNETVVPIRVENGLVHHQNFSVSIGGHTISTSGSVGLDGKLKLMADVPIPAALLKSSPLAAKSLANRRVKVPITGTLTQPKLDPRQFQASIADLAQEAMKDLGKDLLNKELDKLFPGMPRPRK